MSNHSVLIPLTLLVLVFAAATVVSGGGGGKNRKVHDPETDLEIQELGKFCVIIYNHEQDIYHHKKSNLTYQSVVEAHSESDPKGGRVYHLKILVTDKGVPKMFNAELLDKHMRDLRRFVPSPSRSPLPSPSPSPETK